MRALLLGRLAAVRFTLTPNPSPQGGGGQGRRYLGPNRRRLALHSAAAKSPSPLWGGVRGGGFRKGLFTALLLLILPTTTLAATNQDPDWPCIQRKVPQLSLGQIWNGPELPQSAKNWAQDPEIPALVKELAARRVPIGDAQDHIRDFATALPADQKNARMTMLVQGLFDYMNAERSQVIAGIARYARKQLELAARLRKEASEVDALRRKADADINEIAARTDRLTWETRIFEERVQSLTYVCEVPTLIEQRLYALAKAVAEIMAVGNRQ
jgi:hypothetical protein